jgi:hypothetical protein
VRRKARDDWPPGLARYREADWLFQPLTDDERDTFGCTAGTPEGRAQIARARWLWARWEWAQAAGLPRAIDCFVEWLQWPPCPAGD